MPPGVMPPLALRVACFCLAALALAAASDAGEDPLSFLVTYSEAWEDQLVERGVEFTEENQMSMEDFGTEILDAHGARVRRGDKPGREAFPLRVRFVPRPRGAHGSLRHSFTLEHSAEWQDELAAQQKAFCDSHGVPPDAIRVSVVDAAGTRMQRDETPGADRFPIKILLQVPGAQRDELVPGAERDELAPEDKGFKLRYSGDWLKVLGRKMKYFGRDHGITPDKFWPKIVDNKGELVDTGQDVPKTRFPLHVSFVLREGLLDEHLTELSDKLYKQWEKQKESDKAKDHRIEAKARAAKNLYSTQRPPDRAEL